ncbi:MAG: enoyl-CoA hydratase-related protein [Sphingomonas sp.]
MSSAPLSTENRDGVAWVTLNRPERLNAMNDALMDGLVETLTMVADDPAARCVVLGGAGTSFSAGGDVGEMRDRQRATAQADAAGPLLQAQAERLAQRGSASTLLVTMPKPTVAMLRGHAVGGAFALALACDLRVASRTARLRLGFPKLGLSGDYGATWLLAHLIGGAKARELCLLDPVLTAERAFDLGLVTELADDEALEARTAELAGKLAAGPTFGYAKLKENLYRVAGGNLPDHLRAEAMLSRMTAMSRDCAEAGAAFAEKRPPPLHRRLTCRCRSTGTCRCSAIPASAVPGACSAPATITARSTS